MNQFKLFGALFLVCCLTSCRSTLVDTELASPTIFSATMTTSTSIIEIITPTIQETPEPTTVPTSTAYRTTLTPLSTRVVLSTTHPTPSPTQPTVITPLHTKTPTPTIALTLTTSPTLTDILTGPAQAMLYIQHGQLLALDLSELSTVPVTISTQGDLRGAILNRDGKSLIYTDQAALHWLDMQSGHTMPLLDFSVQPWQLFLPLAWSNTGYVLAQHIWDVESLEPVWLTISGKSWHNLPLPEGTTYYGCITGADWSPSTSQIAITGLAYAHTCNNSPGLTIADVEKDTALRIVSRYIRPAPQSSSQIAAGAYSPAWSPNGAWIAFGLDEDAIGPLEFPTRLYLVRPDGSDLVPLTDHPQGQARYPIWITDSRLFYAVSGGGNQVDGIYDCDLAAQKHKQMIGGTALRPLSISPDQRLFVYVQIGQDQQREMTLWDIERRQPLFTITNQDGTPLQFVGWLSF